MITKGMLKQKWTSSEDKKFEFVSHFGHYIATVQIVEPCKSTQFRNRRWAVYWRTATDDDMLAVGFCYNTHAACEAAAAIINLAS